MIKTLKLALVGSCALMLTACASTPEECDPSQDQGFFGVSHPDAVNANGARGETRTLTLTRRRILNPLRLPFRHPGKIQIFYKKPPARRLEV